MKLPTIALSLQMIVAVQIFSSQALAHPVPNGKLRDYLNFFLCAGAK